jgi:cyclopropane fatty-acyl-phospholipid synthase-like methyltransferase
MKRIPERDLMDGKAQTEAYAAADFSEPHESFVTHFKTRFPDFHEGAVLDLGCGTADVIIRFARDYPYAHITGIDGAGAMLDIGLRDVEKQGLTHRVRLRKCFLPDHELVQKKFDAVISNSLLHHLNDPLILWETVKQCAGPGAPIFIMDLIRPESRERAKDLVSLHAADASPTLQEDFFNSFLAAYTIDEISGQLRAAKLQNLTVEAVSDRHALIWGNDHEYE